MPRFHGGGWRLAALTAAVALLASASPAAGRVRDRCQRACRHSCGDAVRACMTTTGKTLRACKAAIRVRCLREGLEVCSPALSPTGGGTCAESAPACGGSCPFAQHRCVPDGAGGCNCEAPACNRTRGTCAIGVCSDPRRTCVLRAGRCRCV